jgi:hypothetical protein
MKLEIDEQKIMDKIIHNVSNEFANDLKKYLQHSYKNDNFEYENFKNQIANLVAQKIYKKLITDPEFMFKIGSAMEKGVSKAVGQCIAKNFKEDNNPIFPKQEPSSTGTKVDLLRNGNSFYY